MRGLSPILLLAFCVPFLPGCGGGGERVPASRDELLAKTWPCDVVVVLLDAARADRFGYQGHQRATTPNIDALAAQSVVFEQAYAQASGTANSVYSFFTSRYPVFESVPDLRGQNAIFLGDDAYTLMEAMAERHPARLMLSTNPFVRAQLGYAQGATTVIEDWEPEPGQDQGKSPKYAERVTGPGMAWIRENHRDGFFAYLHYMEPHEPYMPPEPFLTRFGGENPRHRNLGLAKSLRVLGQQPSPPESRTVDIVSDLYDANLAYVDSHVGALVDSLRTEGLLEKTIIALISDHGEAFWEHDKRGHGHTPYEELIRVPMFIYLPTLPGLAGRRISEPVELVDLMPTLLDLMGIPVQSMDLVGRSLVDVMLEGEGDPERLIHSRSNRTAQPVYAVRRGQWKWMFDIGSGRQELYDLGVDPGEQVDLVAAGGADEGLLEEFRSHFRVWLEGGELPGQLASPVDNQMMDEAMIESLRSLGYID